MSYSSKSFLGKQKPSAPKTLEKDLNDLDINDDAEQRFDYDSEEEKEKVKEEAEAHDDGTSLNIQALK